MGASFDPVYGRMSGNLGMQLPNPTTLNALLVLYGFSDLPTETIANSPEVKVQVLQGTQASIPWAVTDGTQIWKISHNGVDTHPIHFHIFDVQLINRVGWDGQILMPEPNELGWKDTVKISPLEDTIVAVRPRAPMLPFGITNSLRPLNPAIPINSPMGFNSVDWTTGQAITPAVTNILYNFGWEYVWHCHILSHEEMDMMRPIVLNVPTVVPDAPVQTTSTTFTGTVNVGWNDSTPVAMPLSAVPANYNNAKNEIGYKIERCTRVNNQACTDFAQVGSALANTTSFTDATATGSPFYSYRLIAYNASGNSLFSNVVSTTTTDVINGACGASDGGIFIAAPTAGLCTAGVPTAVNYAVPTWSWGCSGINATATTATCSATIQQYVVSFNAGANGTITSGATIQAVNHGANATAVTATPNTAYQFVSWTNSSNAIVSLLPTLAVTNVTANEFYTANFYMPKDFNNDGKADILWTNTTTNNSTVWFMNNVTKLAETALPAAPGAQFSIVATGDFNHDGKTDIIYRNNTTGQNILYYMNGTTKLSQVNLPTLGSPWIIVGAADFGTSSALAVKDGNIDILLRNPTTGQNTIWYMNGATRTGSATLPVLGSPWTVVGVADFGTSSVNAAKDGTQDILLENPSNGQHTVWFMNGATRTGSATLPVLGSPWTIVGVADFGTSSANATKDGNSDILLRNPTTGQNTVWYMNSITRTGSATLSPMVGSNWQIVGK
jgi:hypothetical protein